MEFKDFLPYLSAIIAAILSGIISFITAVKKSSSEIRQVKAQNEHEISKLMNQHKLDLEALVKKHELELESKEREHKFKLEIIEKENQSIILRMQQEQQNSMQSSLFQGFAGGLGSLFASTLDNPEIKKQLSEQLQESFHKRTPSQ